MISPPGRARAGRRAERAALFVAVVIAVAAGTEAGLTAQSQTPGERQAAASRPAVLVVPFASEGHDPRGYWLREASAVILTDDLVSAGIATMSRDERLRAFDSLRVPANAQLSHATVIRVGQVVGVSRVVVGSCAVDGETLTVRVRSIVLDTGEISVEIVESGRLAELFDVYQRVARRLGEGLPHDLPPTPIIHPPVAAFEQYIKGLLAEAPAMKLSFLREALRLSPSLVRARLAMWAVYNELGEHQNALAAVRQVPGTGELSRQAAFLASVSLIQLERFQEAFDALTELNRAGADGSLLNNLGIVQMRRPPGSTGRRAVSYFSDAVAVEGADSDLLFNLGYAYWLERDLPNAIQSLRGVVRRQPADHAAHYLLGVALQMSGSAAESGRELDLARRLSSEYADWEKTRRAPNTVPSGLERLRTELSVPAFRRVESEISAAGQRSQQELVAFYLDAGRRAYLAERDDDAIASLRRAVYLSPYDAEAHLLLGRVYLRGGRHQDAIEQFTISVWSRDTVNVRLALAEAYIQTQNFPAARDELRIVLTREPTNPDGRRLLARVPPE